MQIMIINGPNLNLVGIREPQIYGNVTFEQYLENLKSSFPMHQISYFQSNVEGEIINKIHETGFSYDAIILNAGGYSHTSAAIADTVASVQSPVIEVHISNIFAREAFRHHSYISGKAKGCIIGFGLNSYKLAILSLSE